MVRNKKIPTDGEKNDVPKLELPYYIYVRLDNGIHQ